MWKTIITFVLIVLITVLTLVARKIILVPIEPVHIVADIDSLTLFDPGKTLAVIPKGQRVVVTSCLNLKQDQVYRVKTETGIEGYVSTGRFAIEKKPFWIPTGGNIVICY